MERLPLSGTSWSGQATVTGYDDRSSGLTFRVFHFRVWFNSFFEIFLNAF